MNWLIGIVAVLGLFVLLGMWARSNWRRSVRRQVVELLRQRHPEVTVVKETAAFLEVRFADGGSGTLGLLNLYTGLAMGPREAEAHAEAMRAFVDGALSSTREAAQPLSLDAHGDRLLPRLADAGFANDASAQGQPLVQKATGVEGLVTVYVLDTEQAVMYLGEDRLAELGLDADALHERALANLARHPITETVRGVVERREVAVVKLGDSFDAARLLLVPDALRDGEELVAVVPDRETLGLLPLPSEEGWAAVRKLARTPASPYRLLDRPLRVTRAGFALA